MDEPIPREVQAYYAQGGETRRLFQGHGQIELADSGRRPRAAVAEAASAKKPVSRETHRVKTVGGKKVLERIRFHCRLD